MTFDFIECSTCAETPGAPLLCESCLWNRWVIAKLKKALAHHISAGTEVSYLLAHVEKEYERRK